MDSFNTIFGHACLSLPFVRKVLMECKVCPMDSFNTAFRVLLVHPINFVPKGLMDSNICPMDFFNTAFGPACPSISFVP